MIKYELKFPFHSNPPNTLVQSVPQPNRTDSLIELCIFNDHRYAFYFWNYIKNKNQYNCDLLTFDWHQDLFDPSPGLKEELSNIDLQKDDEVAYFSWARLNPNNDDHILSALYLDLFKDIWVVCKQGEDSQEEVYKDFQGKNHTIRKFKCYRDSIERLKIVSIDNVIMDIDVDYFTIENNTSNDRQHFTYEKRNYVEEIFLLKSDLIEWILPKLAGITIALEPDCTGGISKSYEYLSILESLWFENYIGRYGVKWKR
ncbi:MAG: UPF0489 family protein [Candidatus Marinimicrobia bacterium]|nr:UPF0489 family protein [Candidatus Neomarinimicrobiota bacterium]